MRNIFHHSTAFIARHKHHHHFIVAVLALVVAGTGVYMYRHELAQAATYTFTQTSWAGGVTTATSTHTSNQSNWTQYSATSTNITAGAGGVSLTSTSKVAGDDGVALSALATPTTASLNSGPRGITTSPDGTSVYARSYDTINMYSRNTSTGALTALATPTIAAAGDPFGITVSPDGISVYAVLAGNASVAMYSRDTSTGALTALGTPTIATESDPLDITISPDGTSVYTVNNASSTISMYSRDTSTGALTALGTPTIAAGDPTGITISPDGTSVYVANYSGNTVSMYSRNMSTGALTALATPTIAAGSYPYGIIISADGISVYATNNGGDTVSMYSRNTGTGALTALATPTIATGTTPIGLFISLDGTSVYVANNSGNTVSMYSRNTSTGALTALATPTIAAGTNPRGITISPDGTSVYVTNYNSGTISMYSRSAYGGALGFAAGTFASTEVSFWAGASSSVGLAQTTTNLNVIHQSGNLSKITTSGTVSTTSVGVTYPNALIFGTDGNLFVANSGGNTIRKVTPGGTVTTFATVGAGPNGPAFDASGNLYTANYDDNTVSKITPAGAVTTFATVGAGPRYLAFDTTGNLYTANYSSSTISKITPAGATTTFATVGAGPYSLAFDASGNLYTANYDANTVSKITPAGAVTTFATGFNCPSSFAFDTAGTLLVGNYCDGVISKVTTGGVTSTFVTIETNPRASTFDKVYASSGTFTSAVINTGVESYFSTLAYTTTLNGQTITVDARAGNTATPDGTWTSWQTGIASGGSISGLSYNRYIQYRANFSTSDTAVTPTLNSVTINYGQYALSGDLTSSKYDTEATANLISNVLWSASSTSASETVRFQVRSSSAGTTWTNWCGPATACDGTDYFTVSTGVSGGIVSGHPLRSDSNDRFLQYKAFLASAGGATPTLTSATVQYVVNAPPVISNITASQGSTGAVTVGYDLADSDNAIGNIVDVTLQYCTTNCSAGSEVWADAVTVSGSVGTGVALGTARSISWTASTDYASQYKSNTQKIRIIADDRDAANNLGYGTSPTFTLDTTVPVITVSKLDSSTGGNAVGTISLTSNDDSTLQYRICNDNTFPSSDTQGNSCAFTTLAASPIATTTIAWIPTGAPSHEFAYLQVRDAYGNVTAQTLVAPAMPADFSYNDVSNTTTGVYREFLSWVPFVATTSSTFGSYKVYHSLDNFATSTLLATITDSSVNYYLHTVTTATTSLQYYRVTSVNALGNVSNFTAIISDIPDGTGGVDTTPPHIPIAGIATPTVGNSSANITFSTYTDTSLSVGELATSTVFYASYTGAVPASCPGTPKVSTNTYTVNHSVYLTGLTPSTQYYYCVVARDISGNVSAATTAVGGTFTTVSGPLITNVTEREITDISALIFWNTNTSSDSKVYFSATSAGVNGATPVNGSVVTVAGSDGAYQHQIGLTGLSAGQTYYYKVTSTDTAGTPITTTNDNNGQYYSFVTLRDTTPPTVSGIATPVLSSNAAVIIWQTNEPSTTQVLWGTASSTYTRNTVIDTTKSIYHIVTLSSGTLDTGSVSQVLTPETTYYFVVRSADDAGNLTTSSQSTLTTPATGSVTITTINVVSSASSGSDTKDTTVPIISNIKVSDITPFAAVVKFDTDEDTVGFVEYGAATTYGETAGDKTMARSHTVRLRGLTLGTEYHIKATAVDKSGNAGTSGDQTFKTTFLSENLKDIANIENIEAFQKEIEAAIESILPSLVPPFVSKPQVLDITENSATITFKTNIKAFPVVVYADDGSYDEKKDNPYTGEISDTAKKSAEHSLKLTGLKGNTKYHIQARAFSLPRVIGKSADVTFITKASKIAGSIVERKKDSFTVVWTTDQPTSSIVEFKNVRSGIIGQKTNEALRTSHSMKIENLPPGTAYIVNISGKTEQGNIAEAGSSISVTTSRDVTPPVITGFKVDNALIPGRTDRIQTIVSWTTDEPSNSTAYYEEGTGTKGDTKELANKNSELTSYVTNHAIILPSLKPGTIYRLKVTSSDDSGNLGSFGPRTIITPQQTASITDIIFKNFEDSFKFLKKI
ncbi:MAG: beta-propeller fold lactonase family protein [Patescibacteria group bacterium]